jgi:subtilisin family serine protease
MGKRLRALAGWTSLAVIGFATSAGAEVRLGARFVDALTRAGSARHPLADSVGKIAVTVEMPPGTDARTMGWQPFAPGMASLRVGLTELAAIERANPTFHFSTWPGFSPVLDRSAQLNGTVAYRAALAASGSPLPGTGKGVVVGIIDTGLDVGHPDFLDASGKTRVAWMLDMTQAAAGMHPDLEKEYGCLDPMQSPCAIFERSDLDDLIAHPSKLLPKDVVGHGTHVASIAAGNGGGGAAARFVGGAPEATLIIAGVTHGALEELTDADIATGARFIFDRADALGLPAVINLSLGGDFGPHDGTTALEKSLAAMVSPDHPGRAVVVAAGNSGALYQGASPAETFGIHTHTRVDPAVASRIPLKSPGIPGGADLSGSVFIWATFENGTDIGVSLEGPRGISIGPVHPGERLAAATGDNQVKAAIFNGVPDADTAPLTSDTHGAVIAWDGTWPAGSEIYLRFEGEGMVEAWSQTNLDASPEQVFFEVASRDGTINVPATHPDLIAVGCTVNRTTWTDVAGDAYDLEKIHGYDLLAPDDSTCYFSSAGPTAIGAMKPEISAPGGFVAAAMSAAASPASSMDSIFAAPAGICKSGDACFVVDPGHALLSGSSMSSPQVAGVVALLLERDRTLTQPEIARLLQQGARRPLGVVGADYQLGAGALDARGAMAAYDARTTAIQREPDAAQSWMSLGATYAHPDLVGSVGGTVEVRARDGSLADGFDPARLSLSVSDGMVTEPLARVDAGLWHFAVAGAPNGGAQAMDIDVRLDGVTIGTPETRLSGHRLLPVGADRWVAAGTARAYGGCSVSRSSEAPALVPLAPMAVALGVLRRRRRRAQRCAATAFCSPA